VKHYPDGMSRFRVVLGGISAAFAVFAAFAVLLLLAPGASADPIDDATSTLQSSSLYVAPGAEGRVDNRSAVQNAFGSSVKAAIFPSTVNGPDAVNRLHAAISPQQTLVVFDGNQYQAKSGVYCQGFAQTQMGKAYSDTRANLQATNGDLTNTLVEFANNLKGGPVCANGSGTGSTDTASGESGGGAAVWPWLVGLGVLGAGGVAGVVFYRKRKLKRQLEAAKANVMPYYDRLANEVNTLDPKDNATARQAVADAAERFNSAGSQMDTADSVEKYAAARRTTLEGLYAAVTARKALGLDPGPELPPIEEPRGDQLTKAQDVTVQGQTYQGYPDYTPGAPYYYGGGRGVPGGWYSFPFWETLLIGSVLTGGFGGWGGGGYGAGYDSGYEAGRDSAQDSGNGSDWGGGGSDWGGGGGWGGGGDWGGGGGDWGGGGGDGGGGGW
jgi:hypothetical protein